MGACCAKTNPSNDVQVPLLDDEASAHVQVPLLDDEASAPKMSCAQKRRLEKSAAGSSEAPSPVVWSMAEKSELRFHKEEFRTLLCGHLIPDLAGIALDYLLVLMFVRIIHLALCVILVAGFEGLVVYGGCAIDFFAKKQNNICM